MMGTSLETRPDRVEKFRASSLRTPLTLRTGPLRLSLAPDGSLRFLHSLQEGRLLFGREELHFYKLASGIVVRARSPDWGIEVAPDSVSYSGRVFDSLDMTQTLNFLHASSLGFIRSIGMRNHGDSPIKLRTILVSDPTAAQFRETNNSWGALGVNAFNRSSHVAMDEVAEPPAARVVGSQPQPSVIYMTRERERAEELIQSGELPESTAGTSGHVIVMQQHDLDLKPGERVELNIVSLYNPTKLEAALTDFEDALRATERRTQRGASAACSSAAITTGFLWAKSALQGAEFEGNDLDRLETLGGIVYIDPDAAKAIVRLQPMDRSGSLGHSMDRSRPGLLESSVYLHGASEFALLASEKRYMRSTYSKLRKVANFLLTASSEGSVPLDNSLPQGWRRLIGRGYPTGEVPEVSLSVAKSLSSAGSLARALGRTGDSARFAERAESILSNVRSKLLDNRGFLALSVENGRLRADETIDQAIACYRHQFDEVISSAEVRRLLEKDFATAWGPRTVPASNRVYFSPSYGQGQLGGYWTRAALAHARAGYRVGLAAVASLELEEVGKLVSAGTVRLGGAPGEFPYWIDPLRNEAHGAGSDPVAASRFVEALVCGDAGFFMGPAGQEFHPPTGSRLKWLLLRDIWVGKKASAFIGRAEGRVFSFLSLAHARVDEGWNYSSAESAEAPGGGLTAITFYGPGQAVCVGNGTESPAKSAVVFKPHDPELAKRLSVDLQELDQATGAWRKVSTVRVLTSIAFEVALGPGNWKAFKLAAS